MLKLLEAINDLSTTYVTTSKDYQQHLQRLKTLIRTKFEEVPELASIKITATDSGELRIEPQIFALNRQGEVMPQGMTITYHDLFLIVSVLKEGLD